MSPPRRQKYINGLFVIVESSDGSALVSRIGNRTDVKHLVKVKNCGGYVCNVKCLGEITSDPAKIQYISSRSEDTPSKWYGARKGLVDNQWHVFDHARIVPVNGCNNGREVLDATIDVLWPEPARSNSGTVSISVNI